MAPGEVQPKQMTRIRNCGMTSPLQVAYRYRMNWIYRTLAMLAAAAGCCTPVHAQKSDEAAPLTSEELESAAKVDTLSMPTPGELMSAINKLGKPDWAVEIRPPIATNFSSRAQMALNLGGLIADGYLAVEAENAQQVKNIGSDIMALAKPLSIQQDIINRGKSLTDFAEQGQWNTLKEELEATQNEVEDAMAENKDQDLVTLVTIGGWLRGTEVISDYVAKHYSEAAAKLLRQPAIVHILSQRVNALPEKVRDDPAVHAVRVALLKIESAVSFAHDKAPGREAVRDLNATTSDLMKELAKRESK